MAGAPSRVQRPLLERVGPLLGDRELLLTVAGDDDGSRLPSVQAEGIAMAKRVPGGTHDGDARKRAGESLSVSRRAPQATASGRPTGAVRPACAPRSAPVVRARWWSQRAGDQRRRVPASMRPHPP